MPQVSALNQHTQKVAGMLDFTSKSTCYSPFSLMHALSLLTKCSNDASIQELVQKLELNEAQIQDFVAQLKKDASVAVASNIFDANILGVNEDFKKLMLKQYDVVPEQLVSAAQVNGWCAKHTNNKVKEIMDDILGAETILISAIHFKAAWDFKFSPYMTHKRSFTGFSRESEVDMMQITFKVDYVQTKTAQVVRLPYSDSSLSAYIILPLSKSESDFKAALSLINLHAFIYPVLRLTPPSTQYHSCNSLECKKYSIIQTALKHWAKHFLFNKQSRKRSWKRMRKELRRLLLQLLNRLKDPVSRSFKRKW
ncbi:Serpin_1 [Hexamita inflata]|uniref:Serpin 1 n=1 Tax=Hexamita inflata TaxID=28002 RepID=A0AA86PZM9_9EUKA|nr:Serpin 1 [Hexamita inflata]